LLFVSRGRRNTGRGALYAQEPAAGKVESIRGNAFAEGHDKKRRTLMVDRHKDRSSSEQIEGALISAATPAGAAAGLRYPEAQMKSVYL
jgi:hypothetical protein